MESQIEKVRKSFSVQAGSFESGGMSFSKQEYLDFTVRKMGLKGTESVLEVASGTCALGRAVSPHVRSVTCLDATPEMLRIGREKSREAGLTNIEFRQGLAEELPFENGSFDAVMTRLSFHHFREMERPFEEMHRVLRQGGKLVIIDMEAADEQLRDTEDRIETMRDRSHVRNRSKAEISSLFSSHRYAMECCESTRIPVSLDAWMDLTATPDETRAEIVRLMEQDIGGRDKDRLQPVPEGRTDLLRSEVVPLDRSEACPLKAGQGNAPYLSPSSQSASPLRINGGPRLFSGMQGNGIVPSARQAVPDVTLFKSASPQFLSPVSIISVMHSRLRQRDGAGISILTERDEPQKSGKRVT